MKKLFTLVLVITFNSIFSQESQGIPPSPTVASLVTVEKDSVNNTGMIVQKVPLWTIKIGKHSFPIDMTYSSSGVKVEQIPAYVGTGWNLSAGGVITRSVIDLPDDLINPHHGNGILHTNMMNEIKNLEYYTSTNGYNETVAQSFIKSAVNLGSTEGIRHDTQPDIFYFNFFGKQGKFIFNENKEIVSLTNDNYKISYKLASDHTLESFSIIDTQGIRYNFSEREYSQTVSVGGRAWEFLNKSSIEERELFYSSSWHLKSVSVPDNRFISFEYDDELLNYAIRGVVMGKICGTSQCEDTSPSTEINHDVLNQTDGTGTVYNISSKKIKKISCRDLFEINFTNTSREDLNGGKKLSSISINNMYGIEVNKFDFNYSYFNSPSMPGSNNWEYKRLKLIRINQNDQFYQEFEYYEDYALPHRKSTEQDYWGYYNKNGASSLVPKVYVENDQHFYKYHVFQPLNTSYATYGQIDRSANKNYIHMGMLKKIEYQTGGTKTFFYEPNDFTHTTYTNVNNPSIKGNGVRLQKIEYFDGSNIEELNYDYKNPGTGMTSGKISYLPQFAAHIPWNFVYQRYSWAYGVTSPASSFSGIHEIHTDYNQQDNTYYQYQCLSNGGVDVYNYTPTNQKEKYFAITTRRFSVSQIPLAHNVEHPLSYEYITLKEGNNGKKEYKFNTIGALGEALPSSFDESKFKNRESYKTYHWYLGDNTPLQEGICYGNQLLPLGPSMFTVVNNYMNYLDLSGNSHPFAPAPNWNRYFGSLSEFTYFNEAGYKVFKESYQYDTRGSFIASDDEESNKIEKVISLKYNLFSRPHGRGWSFSGYSSNGPIMQPTVWVWSFVDTYYGIGLSPTKITRTNYYENESKSIIKERENFYTWGNLLTTSFDFELNGEKHGTQYRYPISYAAGNNTYKRMVDQNIIVPISKSNFTFIGSEGIVRTLSADLHEYEDVNTGIVIKKKFELEKNNHSYLYDANPQPNTNLTSITKISDMKEKITYDRYDDYGNLLEYRNVNDTRHVIIWGYNHTYPIATFEGDAFIGYQKIKTLLADSSDNISIPELQELSNTGQEIELISKLAKVRLLLKDYLMTSYTYKPLVGVTSITNPRGETTYYHYDAFNRLEYIKDANGKVLSKNRYNYKN